MVKAVEESRSKSKGLVGFGEIDLSKHEATVVLTCRAPGIEPDLDDSAKASILLSLAGKSGFSSSIVKEFDAATCLKTYRGERDPSVSANCNALMSILLDSHDYAMKDPTIEKIVRFVLAEWNASGGSMQDKWVCPSLFCSTDCWD